MVASGIYVNDLSGALLASPPKSWYPKKPGLLLPAPALVL